MHSVSFKTLIIAGGMLGTSTISHALTFTPDQQILLDDSDNTSSQIVTGRDNGDTQSWWQCDLAAAADTQDQSSSEALELRLWADGRGYMDNASLDWQMSGNNLQLEFASSRSTITNVAIDADNEFNSFSGTSAAGEPIRCQWEGKGRTSAALGTLDDQSDGYVEFLTGAQGSGTEALWNCDITERDGSKSSVSLKLARGGFGVLNGVPMDWFIDERAHLVMTAGTQLTVFDEVHFPDASNPNQFHAEDRAAAVSCLR